METPHLPIKGHISILHLLLDIVFLALLAATIYFGIRHYQGQERIRYLEDRVEQFSSSEKIVDFLDLFIAKILKGEQDISFEEWKESWPNRRKKTMLEIFMIQKSWHIGTDLQKQKMM